MLDRITFDPKIMRGRAAVGNDVPRAHGRRRGGKYVELA